MTENLETKFIPTEKLQTQSPEVKGGESFSPVDTNRQTSSQPVKIQPLSQIAQEPVLDKPVSPDIIVTTGDKWNKVIEDKELGVAPTVL